MKGADVVFHLAANADVRFGARHPRKEPGAEHHRHLQRPRGHASHRLEEGRLQLHRLLYGEASVIPTPETSPSPVRTSLYGASKLAGEGLISANCEGFGFRVDLLFCLHPGRTVHPRPRVRLLQEPVGEPRAAARARRRQATEVLPIYIQDCILAIFTARSTDPGSPRRPNYGGEIFAAAAR